MCMDAGRLSENAVILIADVDECSGIADECGAGEKCVNVPGDYSCECQKPYKKNKKGHCVPPISKLCMVIRILRNENSDANEDSWIYVLLLKFEIIGRVV